jgi:DNA invertase Pin-like site-specific DNA recombinase
MKIGYARVSTKEQCLEAQIEALTKFGCTRIFSEKISGAKAKMPELDACLAFLRSGDTLVVYHLDRLNRVSSRLLTLHEELRERDITLQVITLPIDLNDPTVGKLVLTIFSALAETEYNIKKERSYLGMAKARAGGRKGGRIYKLTLDKRQLVIDAYNSRKYSLKQMAHMFNICVSTLMNYTESERNK